MSDEHNCAICLEALEEDQTYTVPECGHKFHYECIIPWLDRAITHARIVEEEGTSTASTRFTAPGT